MVNWCLHTSICATWLYKRYASVFILWLVGCHRIPKATWHEARQRIWKHVAWSAVVCKLSSPNRWQCRWVLWSPNATFTSWGRHHRKYDISGVYLASYVFWMSNFSVIKTYTGNATTSSCPFSFFNSFMFHLQVDVVGPLLLNASLLLVLTTDYSDWLVQVTELIDSN